MPQIEAAETFIRENPIHPRVDYALTDRGRSVLPVIEAMKAWGEANVPAPGNTGRS